MKTFEGRSLGKDGLKLFNNKMKGHEFMVIGDTAQTFNLSVLQ